SSPIQIRTYILRNRGHHINPVRSGAIVPRLLLGVQTEAKAHEFVKIGCLEKTIMRFLSLLLSHVLTFRTSIKPLARCGSHETSPQERATSEHSARALGCQPSPHANQYMPTLIKPAALVGKGRVHAF